MNQNNHGQSPLTSSVFTGRRDNCDIFLARIAGYAFIVPIGTGGRMITPSVELDQDVREAIVEACDRAPGRRGYLPLGPRIP